jgi:hypothetical protein
MEKPEYYEIHVENQLPKDLVADWFEGLIARDEPGGTTVLRGLIADQSALQGVLQRLHDLNLKLIMVRRVVPAPISGREEAAGL